MAVSPSFDDNKWYQFTTISTGNGSGLVAAWPTSYPAGSVFGAPFSAQGPDFYNQKWQIFESPIDSSAFVLREEVPGPNVFLGVKVNETCAALSNSSCYLLNPTMQLALDDTSTWYIEPSGDETFYMYNRANGSNYHMDTEPGGSWLWMNSDVTERKTQQWNFTAIEPINNSSFSTVSASMIATMTTVGTMASSVSISIPSPSSTANSTSNVPPHSPPTASSSSMGIKAGIGGAVAGASSLVLIVVGFLGWRRRTRIRSKSWHAPECSVERDGNTRAEAPLDPACHHTPAELANTIRQHELHDTTMRFELGPEPNFVGREPPPSHNGSLAP